MQPGSCQETSGAAHRPFLFFSPAPVIYPAQFEEKIQFNHIRELLRRECFSSLGLKEVEAMHFLTRASCISTLVDQTWEFRQIIESGASFPGAHYVDTEEMFAHLRMEDTFVEAEMLQDFRLSLQTILEVIAFLGMRTEEGHWMYPALHTLTEGLDPDRELLQQIGRVLDEDGQIKDSASEDLFRIRKKKRETEKRAGTRIVQMLREAKSQAWVLQETELTLRDGRLVMPVPASHKRRIKGYVHGQSATGQTVYLEPEEVFELNNLLRELETDERREVIRILKGLADLIRPHIPALKACYLMLGRVDFTRAKARLAIAMEAIQPRLDKQAAFRWIQARHPLLYLSYKPQNKHVEPLDIELGVEDQRILVISGPNAGGKSVCLKTCGLLQYMLQCGMLIPVKEGSSAGVFERIFLDIGDEQSLENDLSTYSSHLINLKFFLENSHDKTLFLIDEFGAGTEPRMGGAMAEAVLARLNELHAVGVVTTHYANLKLMAGKHKGIVNGSMMFDTKKLKPLFRLKTGSPGSSFAFEIARSIGMPPDILDRAAGISGQKELDFERQLENLDQKKLEQEEKERELHSAESFLTEMIEKYEKLHAELSAQKSDILLRSREEASHILAETNRIIEKTIREIKESQAEKEATRQARKALQEFRAKQEAALGSMSKKRAPKTQAKKAALPSGPIRVGDEVRIKGQDSAGEVMELSGKQAVISFGSIKFRTPIDKLEKTGRHRPDTGATQARGQIRSRIDLSQVAAHFKPELDLRGLRAEEALAAMETHVDQARMLGRKHLRILHGKGDGILRTVIRDWLRKTQGITAFRDEHPDQGGAGITLATLD